MNTEQTKLPMMLPFGKHEGQPLAEVPASYLQWLLREFKLSSGLRAAVAGELQRRGIEAPPPPTPKPPKPLPPCHRCGGVALRFTWTEDSLGRRQIRRSCAGCGGFRSFAPQVEPYISEAAAASPTGVLDVARTGVGARRKRVGIFFATFSVQLAGGMVQTHPATHSQREEPEMALDLTIRVNVQVHPFGKYQTQAIVRLAPEAREVPQADVEILPPTSAETQLFGSEPVRILESY